MLINFKLLLVNAVEYKNKVVNHKTWTQIQIRTQDNNIKFAKKTNIHNNSKNLKWSSTDNWPKTHIKFYFFKETGINQIKWN